MPWVQSKVDEVKKGIKFKRAGQGHTLGSADHQPSAQQPGFVPSTIAPLHRSRTEVDRVCACRATTLAGVLVACAAIVVECDCRSQY